MVDASLAKTTTNDAFLMPLDSLSSSRNARTLLPRPFATAVSLFTATSAFSLRVGGAIGNGLVSMGRVTTLTAFEVTRAALEGILSRAGQDLVQTSQGDMSRAAAESVLERALIALHQVITTSSFLVSASFQIGSTGISSSLAVGETLLNALNSLFGDTETSKAVATIIVLVRREVSSPGAIPHGEVVGLGDLLTSIVAFVLLQRWSRRRTTVEDSKTGCTEVIWDIVVLAEPTEPSKPISPLLSSRRDRLEARQRPQSSASFMSALGDTHDLEATSIDTSNQFLPTMHHQQREPAAEGRSGHSFKDQILSQLRPGTNVHITVESITLNSVTIEIEDDHANWPTAPPGYHLVQNYNIEPGRRKLVFHNKVQKRKSGECEVPRRSSSIVSELERDDPSSRSASTSPPKDSSQAQSTPTQANQKRLRTSNAMGTDRTLPVRTTSFLKRIDLSGAPNMPIPGINGGNKHSHTPRRAYKNLVDFWNGTQLKNKSSDRQRGMADSHLKPLARSHSRPPSPTQALPKLGSLSSLHTLQQDVDPYSLPTAENLAAWNAREKHPPKSGRHHRRTASVYSVISAASETSLVLHARPQETGRDAMITSLTRSGRMLGQYPEAPFAVNALRFLRFAIASYGESFLRILGTMTAESNTRGKPSLDDPKEHHAFSTYTRLPPSTVLLSSYVDPHGVPLAEGLPDSGTVLVHYVSLDHDSRAVVLTCRGTLGVEDILTDLTADYEDFYWQGELHQVHQGILAAAYKLLHSHKGRVMATLAAALEEFPDYGLILCGHSLGGGVASVLAMLLAEPAGGRFGRDNAFVTRSCDDRYFSLPSYGSETRSQEKMPSCPLPPGRPVQVYAYGPAASVSPSLQKATRGLVTSILHGQDSVSFLSLGTLRDFQSVARAFKADQGTVKQEIRRRIWDRLQKAFTDRSGSSDQWLPPDALSEDPWPWLALQGLRSNLDAVKLVPPGDVFHINVHPVLQRHAFVVDTSERSTAGRTFKPANHITVTYVKDVEAKFREITFGASMWFDHMPMRYESALEALEKGLG